ncbi:hypothetical protein BJX65DRAFT_143694 [Aspergillus insuetus]
MASFILSLMANHPTASSVSLQSIPQRACGVQDVLVTSRGQPEFRSACLSLPRRASRLEQFPASLTSGVCLAGSTLNITSMEVGIPCYLPINHRRSRARLTIFPLSFFFYLPSSDAKLHSGRRFYIPTILQSPKMESRTVLTKSHPFHQVRSASFRLPVCSSRHADIFGM